MITTRENVTYEDLVFPVSKAYDTGYLNVGDGHQLYYQQIGNPDGVPVLLVHGGPGLGIEAGSRLTRIHDPRYFRIIAIDQRGCGASKPHFTDDPKKSLAHNTPDHLVADFESLRMHLDIPAWHLFGYSWGACLAAYYAAYHADIVKSLTIGGIWMHTPSEIDWYINRMGLFLPEAEADLLRVLPKTVQRFDRLPYLYKSITGTDKKLALKIGEAQGRFEDAAVKFESPQKHTAAKTKQTAAQKKSEQRMMISLGALEIFYMAQNALPPDWYKIAAVKKSLKRIKDIALIQGRYDIVCPPTTAYEFHTAHPHSTLTFVHYAGHRTSEVQMCAALISANRRLQKR
jgi:proline iminopeptidase